MFSGFGEIPIHTWRWLLTCLVFAGLVLYAGIRYGVVLALGALLIASLALAGWGWYAAARYQSALKRREQQFQQAFATATETNQEALLAAQERLVQAERQRNEEKRRLEMLSQLNRALVEAQDEKTLMDAALSALTGLVGALGCSFVPVDEWNQPLPAFTYGQLPEPVLQAWANHLTTNLLRDRCGSCKLLVGPAGSCPLHPSEAGDAMRVFCLPVTSGTEEPNYQDLQLIVNGKSLRPGRADPIVGVIHLYLPIGRVVDPDMRHFLDGLLQEIFLAYNSIRLRTQELTTLRQLQMLHAPENDLLISLRMMLDGLKQALDAECILVRLRPSADERFSNLNLISGETCGIEEEEIEAIFTRVVAGSVLASNQGETPGLYASEEGKVPVWVALPLVLPDSSQRLSLMPAGHVLGMLMVGSSHPHEFHPRQLAILQTVSAQAALLIENERLIRSLEYKVVIQERARLAREIHDGLAQTLAYLKLQSAQMQTYLAQGDTARLAQVLKDNYQALAEAYLDTRQSIDNLRLTPQEGLTTWLERTLREFENTSGLHVERRIKPIQRAIAPEIQAQLIRIVQESLSNIRKHARAKVVRLEMHEWKGAIQIEVSDDGLGFDADDVPEISRHGLRGMRERAEMIGADFQIISKSHQGTTVRLVLPASLEEEPLP